MPLSKQKTHQSKLTECADQHPYVIKLNIKLYKLDTLMNQIFEIADSNLILTYAKTGLNDFSMNESFAKKLNSVSKNVHSLANNYPGKSRATESKN